jgi:DNA repair protein RadC
MSTNLKDLPTCQRPREKAWKQGLENLSDSELLCILIGSGGKGHTAMELANSLLKNFENFRKLALAPLLEIQKIKGIGPVKALEIKACLEIAKRFQQILFQPGEVLSRSEQVFFHFHEKLRDQKKELFYAVLLDSKNRIIREELISIGSLNFSIVHPREVFIPAIREAAASVLLLHNHPSGDPTPSKEDIGITHRLLEVGKIVGIEVLDHVIVGNGCYISFVEQNLIPHKKNLFNGP